MPSLANLHAISAGVMVGGLSLVYNGVGGSLQ